LHLALDKQTSFKDAFSAKFNNKNEATIQRRCDICKSNEENNTFMFEEYIIKKNPPVLIIENENVNTFDQPKTIQITITINEQKYSLRSFILHIGTGKITKGHYITYILKPIIDMQCTVTEYDDGNVQDRFSRPVKNNKMTLPDFNNYFEGRLTRIALLLYERTCEDIIKEYKKLKKK
jgi:uncharacterized UBP type Zn finger protein